ncbi:MAG: hypothetical protein WCG42_04095 [Parachlamydiaceae bacterium]
MNKRNLFVALMGVCGVLLFGTDLVAEEIGQKTHVIVGERAEPTEQRNLRLEKRAATVAQEKKKAKKSASKKVQVPRALASQSIYYTTHSAAYSSPVSVSFIGDSVELLDGSIWSVNPVDAYKVIGWFPSDIVVITPNHSWFSSYYYRLNNQNTGESVAVNLYLGPIAPSYNGAYTHWITAVDYYRNTVYLEDGSVWHMSTFDRDVVNQWVMNDIVIVGVNDGFASSYNPNILINVNMLNYAAGAVGY